MYVHACYCNSTTQQMYCNQTARRFATTTAVEPADPKTCGVIFMPMHVRAFTFGAANKSVTTQADL